MTQALIDFYTGLLATEYHDKPKAFAETELLATEWGALQDFIASFEEAFNLDTATGDQLRKIAAIVGQPIVVDANIGKFFFGFSGTLNARTFGQAPFFKGRTDTSLTPTELTDNQLRRFIRGRIALNTASATISSDTHISLQDAIQILFDYRAHLVNNFDMTMTLVVDAGFPQDELTLITASNLIPSPQGVRIIIDQQ